MTTRWWALAFMLLTTLFTSVAQLLYKEGSARLPELITNWPLLLGACLYMIGAALMFLSFKGGEVSILYPILATSYIWVTIGSVVMFNEQVGALRIVGLCLIVAGVVALTRSGRSDVIAAVEVP